MQMQVGIEGTGLSLKGVGINVGKVAYILMREAQGEPIVALKMGDSLDIGGESSTLGIVRLATKWFRVNVAKHDWLFDSKELIDRQAELNVTGGAFGNVDKALVNVTLTVLDKFNEAKWTLQARNLAVVDGSYNIGRFQIKSSLQRIDAKRVAITTDDGDIAIAPTTKSLEPSEQ
jgi:hypothetical protein